MLIYVGIPVLVILIVFGLVFAGEARRGNTKRYRPGRPYEFRPVWFLSSPDQVAGGGRADHKAVLAGTAPAALTTGGDAETAGEWPAGDAGRHGATGGASDRW